MNNRVPRRKPGPNRTVSPQGTGLLGARKASLCGMLRRGTES
jgi:hypothetical protein